LSQKLFHSNLEIVPADFVIGDIPTFLFLVDASLELWAMDIEGNVLG
jgi:hypothetical protein